MNLKSNTPEFYGYKIGENIVPYINKCIESTGECYIGEGTHLVGRNDKNWREGNVWGDNCIQWGWVKKHDVKIKGAGREKTILKNIDNIQSRYLFDQVKDTIYMLQTNYYESCDNTIISDITFDGNYTNNFQTSTVNCIRLRGQNTTIRNCKFVDFGVGDNQKAECFDIAVGPIGVGKGPTLVNNIFTKMGNKKNSPAGFVPEHSLIAFGGNDAVISKNVFIDCYFNPKTQQSPVHGITFGETNNATITENIFINFDGQCIYNDSFRNYNANIKNNKALNVYNFIQLTCQKWADVNQITFNKDHIIDKNVVVLSESPAYSQWDKAPGVSSFFGYIYSPEVNRFVEGFKNIVVSNNKIYLGEYVINKKRKSSDLLICYWGPSVDDTKIKMVTNRIETNRKIRIKDFKSLMTDAMTEINKNKQGVNSKPVVHVQPEV